MQTVKVIVANVTARHLETMAVPSDSYFVQKHLRSTLGRTPALHEWVLTPKFPLESNFRLLMTPAAREPMNIIIIHKTDDQYRNSRNT